MNEQEPPYSFQVFLGALIACVFITGVCVSLGWAS